jgi:hypothetical protein
MIGLLEALGESLLTDLAKSLVLGVVAGIAGGHIHHTMTKSRPRRPPRLPDAVDPHLKGSLRCK